MRGARLFRLANRLNPTSHGRHFVADLAAHVSALPRDGIYQLEDGVVMDLRMGDFIERSLYFDCFEFLCKRVILGCLRPGSVFIDIGANVGYFSLLANLKVGASGRVLAFEPNPITANQLRRNITLSSARCITIHEVALSEHPGTAQLYCPSNETHGHASMRDHGWSERECYEIQTSRLDDLIDGAVERIDLIKADIEGAEFQAFRGAQKTITDFKPSVLLELNARSAAVFGYDTLDVVKLLLSYNPKYRIKLISGHSITSVSLDFLIENNIRSGNLLLF